MLLGEAWFRNTSTPNNQRSFGVLWVSITMDTTICHTMICSKDVCCPIITIKILNQLHCLRNTFVDRQYVLYVLLRCRSFCMTNSIDSKQVQEEYDLVFLETGLEVRIRGDTDL